MRREISKSGKLIRLSVERWQHIVAEHAEMAGLEEQVMDVICDPLFIFSGGGGELIAVNALASRKWLVVVYREMEDDGFVITAFFTRRTRWFRRRQQVWP
jgi:hypothetical protein